MSGGNQSRQIARCAAADKYAACARGKSGNVSNPPQCLVLGIDSTGALEPAAGTDVRCAHYQIEKCRHLRWGGGDECQIPGVILGNTGGGQCVDE